MFLLWRHSNKSSKIKTKSTSHTSSYFRHYSSHRSSLRSLTHGARTPHSPGSSRQSYWAGYLPRTCSRTRNANTNSPKTASTHTPTAKWWFFLKKNQILTLWWEGFHPPTSTGLLTFHPSVQSTLPCHSRISCWWSSVKGNVVLIHMLSREASPWSHSLRRF